MIVDNVVAQISAFGHRLLLYSYPAHSAGLAGHDGRLEGGAGSNGVRLVSAYAVTGGDWVGQYGCWQYSTVGPGLVSTGLILVEPCWPLLVGCYLLLVVA